MEAQTIYQQVEARSLKRIKNFVEDLTKYDREALTKYPKDPFLHITRDNGTRYINLTTLKPEDPEYDKASDTIKHRTAVMEYTHQQDQDEPKPQLCLYFDGKTLKKVTIDKAKEIFYNEYARKQGRIIHEHFLSQSQKKYS